LPFPYVGLDHAKIAEVAAEHLLSKGMRHFGFYGSEPGIHAGLDERARAFQSTIAAANRTYGVLTVGGGADERDWEHEQQRLAVWIQSLPKPVGIMASNDERGLQVLDACRRAGLHVPDEVAVIGVDNDELLCDLAVPPLTSIDVNGEQIGYQAAATLDKMMAGEENIPASAKLGPRGVVTRRSTDVIASEDPEVNRAISFIRENAARPLSVIDVLAHLNMSRAALQTRMKHVLGHTIHQEIERVRLARAKELLATSDMTIKQVTHLTGFSSVQYMTRVFRAVVGETPAIFRKQRRG
jgi:LacI family transcriptional regulator